MHVYPLIAIPQPFVGDPADPADLSEIEPTPGTKAKRPPSDRPAIDPSSTGTVTLPEWAVANSERQAGRQ
jgi:hypothetical protein